jgi:PIN domain nuclease of toxin-antitoxin system
VGILQVKYLLDTHVWIWWNMNPAQLSRKVKNLIADSGKYDELLLSAISPWELCKLIEKKRLAIACDPEEWIKIALDMPKLRLVPLTPVIAYKSTALPGVFHDDPADQIIVATGREENAVVISKDERIRNYKLVKSIW